MFSFFNDSSTCTDQPLSFEEIARSFVVSFCDFGISSELTEKIYSFDVFRQERGFVRGGSLTTAPLLGEYKRLTSEEDGGVHEHEGLRMRHARRELYTSETIR